MAHDRIVTSGLKARVHGDARGLCAVLCGKFLIPPQGLSIASAILNAVASYLLYMRSYYVREGEQYEMSACQKVGVDQSRATPSCLA
jgi:hypothetical protein